MREFNAREIAEGIVLEAYDLESAIQLLTKHITEAHAQGAADEKERAKERMNTVLSTLEKALAEYERLSK